MVLSEGESAPEVSARNQDGEAVSIDGTEPAVLYFYPRDDTPGCSLEARQFQAELETFAEAGVTVYGVSTDGVDSHADFASSEDLEFDLLADPDSALVEAFDVETRSGAAARTTFVLDDGRVWRVYENVSPDGHARSVLEDLLDAGLVELPDL